MSRSPLAATSEEDHQAYFQAWNTLGSLAAHGKSFSGRERHCVFWNTGAPTRSFADISGPSGLDFPDDGRGLAVVDWDQDGDLDLWFSNRTAPRVRFVRNDNATDNHFTAFQLEGRHCNRDAIGARLELTLGGSTPRTIVKSLAAGTGFLSQSSKWVHFGIGNQESLEKLVVKWPNQATETFTGLEVDCRYQIVQGSGQITLWEKSRNLLALEPSEPPHISSTDQARIILVDPVELPSVTFQRLDGTTVSLTDALHQNDPLKKNTGLLINLWATWCQPCLQELRQFSEHVKELRAAGLDVLALSVDTIDLQPPSTANSVSLPVDNPTDNRVDANGIGAFLQGLDFPFQAGIANWEVINGWEQLQTGVVSEKRFMPIPTSFLVNRKGKVCVIYKGEVTIDRLLADMQLLEADSASLFQAATPFAGRWIADAIGARPVVSARTYLEAGYMEEALHYLNESMRSGLKDPATLLTVAKLYTDQGNFQQATEQLHQALAIDPSSAEIRQQLALTFYFQGNTMESIEELRKVVKQEPRSISAANSLAWILATDSADTLRDGPEAVRLAENVCQITNYRVPKLLDTLAVAYAEVGRFTEAVRVIQQAIQQVEDQGNEQFLQDLQARLMLFEKNLAFHVESKDGKER